MNKSRRVAQKLHLRRETLSELTPARLAEAAGATQTHQWYCFYDFLSIEYSFCQC